MLYALRVFRIDKEQSFHEKVTAVNDILAKDSIDPAK